MPKRDWAEETRPMYDFGYELGKLGLKYSERDVVVAAKFGNVAAYLDAATEGYYDAQEDSESND